MGENRLDFYNLLQSHKPGVIPREQLWAGDSRLRKTSGAFQNKEGEELANNSGILQPDEMCQAFDNISWCSISNAGFVDGRLHIQAKTSPECENDLASINFVDQNGGVVYNGHLFLGFAGMEDKGEGDDKHTGITAQYKEIIYEGVESIEQLNGLSVTIDYMREGVVTEGDWSFTFQIPEKSTADINAPNDVVIGGKTVKPGKISISPLGVAFHLPKDIAEGYNRTDTLQVVYENGEAVNLTPTSINAYEGGASLVFGGQVIDAGRVKRIVLNGEAIDVVPGA